MEKKKVSKKDITYYVVFAILIGLMIWPTSRTYMQQGLMKIGLFKPNIEKGQVNNEGSASPMVLTETMSISDQQGNRLSTHDLRGKVVFINLWATWCGPCRAEMPSIQKLYDKYKDNDKIAFLLVEIEHDQEGAIKFLEKENLNLPIYFPESQIPDTWMSGAIPSTVVLNKNGTRVFEHKGMADYSTKEFEDYIISLINE